MRAMWALALILIFSPQLAVAQGADRCGDSPLLRNTEIESEIDGEVSGLARFLASAELSGQAKIKFEEIISKYPDADKLLMNAYYQYQMCVLIFNDSEMPTDEKIRQLRNVNEKLMGIENKSDGSPSAPKSFDEQLFLHNTSCRAYSVYETVFSCTNEKCKIDFNDQRPKARDILFKREDVYLNRMVDRTDGDDKVFAEMRCFSGNCITKLDNGQDRIMVSAFHIHYSDARCVEQIVSIFSEG